MHWLYRLRLGGLVMVLVSLALSAGAARAQAKSVTVLRRDGDITLLANGDVVVVETWEVQFTGGPFEFAYRGLPLHKVEQVTGWEVSEGGVIYRESAEPASYAFQMETDGDQQRITWYFPPTTNQTRTFILRYTLHGALRIEASADQFHWKFVEADRSYVIQASSVLLHFPARFETAQLRATTYQNTVEGAGAEIVDGETIRFSGGPFDANIEWEIRAWFPHGVVTASAPAWQLAEVEAAPVTAPSQDFYGDLRSVLFGTGCFAVSVIPLLALLLRWVRAGGLPGLWIGSADGDGGGGGDGGGDGGGGGDSGFG